MQRPDPARIRALVSLLSDANPRVVDGARKALLDHGSKALPDLDDAIESADAKLRGRARLVRDDVRGRVLEGAMRQLGERIDHDEAALEEGCVLLARSRDFELDASTIRTTLDRLADGLAARLPAVREPAAVAQAISRFLGREVGFQGAPRNYYDPDNWFLHLVLERRIGIPISLSAVYLFVARRLGLPLIGIGLPGHFVVRYGAMESGLYLDPFHGGRVLDEAECVRFLEERQVDYDPSHLLPVSDGAILLRMLRNLVQSYRTRGDSSRVQFLLRMRSMLVGEEVSGPELGAGEVDR